MGNISITQELNRENIRTNQDQKWEEEIYQEICQEGQQRAIKRLEAIEERLYRARPACWKIIGFRERTLVARFGDVRIKRRLYQDESGSYHFLLDEHLGWLPHQLATPDLQECLVEQATQKTFRPVSKTLEKLTAGVLSARTIHRLVQKTAQIAIEEEKAGWQALYERGELPPGEERQVPILFSEGDGIFISLQREEQSQYELKNAIAYEGWEKLAGKEERYRLVNKRVYCQANEEIPFWEGAGLEWAKKWDLSCLKKLIIGGDGANWIDSGVGEFPDAVRNLDGFHLARACGRGWEEGKTIYQSIRAGKIEEAHRLMQILKPKEKAGVQKARQYVERNVEKGQDWRTQVKIAGIEGRGMGTMEANEDKLVANRMKKQGLSWTKGGALRMHKAIQMVANREIRPLCLRSRLVKTKQLTIPTETFKSRSAGHQKWLEANLPALSGPHASRPWVEKLRSMAHDSYLLN